MTLVQHIGDLRLRRFRAAELALDERETVERHLDGCKGCRLKLSGLDDEQRAFERTVPFDAFAAGVERARRVPRTVHGRTRWQTATVFVSATMAIAAASFFLIGSGALPGARHANESDDLSARYGGTGRPIPQQTGVVSSRTKGGSSGAVVRVVGADGTSLRSPESGQPLRLSPRERLQLGYRVVGTLFLIAISVDERGSVTPIYPETGMALPVSPAAAVTFFPEALSLEGAGRERLFVVLSETALTVHTVKSAVDVAFVSAHQDIGQIETLVIPGATLTVQTWIFVKP